MGVSEQTRITLECFPTLTAEQTQKVVAVWAQNEYPDTWDGHQQAQADLLSMCRWESMSAQQRDDESERLRKGR